jgi:glycine cleavage system H protein
LEEYNMNHPTELLYSKTHEWVLEEDGVATIGISDYAQDALGDLVFVNLPQEGDEVVAGEAFGDVESVKAVSDLICPVSGVVCAVNEELLDAPELLNNNPYGAWIIKVENITYREELLEAAEYEAFCATEG